VSVLASINCGILFLIFVLINQWTVTRISNLEEQEKRTAEQQARTSRAELVKTQAKTDELSAELLRFVAPRSLPDDQLDALRACLHDGPRGPVVMAFLKTENDAEGYATQIGKVLTETGYDVTTSSTVWLQLPVKGIYLCARDVANAPVHAVHIQRCFQTAGIRLRAHEDRKMFSDMNVPEDSIIFIVGARE